MLPMRNGRHLWKCYRTARTKGGFSCLYQSIDWTQLKPLDGRSCKSMIPLCWTGLPQAVPIETIIETKFDLTLEYHCLRKNGSILGETIFDEGAAILYDQDEKRYRLIAVKAGTILVEERLCVDRLLGRLRFTCAHELGHWVLHQKLYSGTGDVAAYEGKTSLDESHGLVEWQADALATALLMPLPQIKRSFYRLRAGRSNEQLVAEMAQIFQVSKQAMRIRLETRNLI